MKIDLQTVNFTISDIFREQVEARIHSFDRYYQGITGVDVYLKDLNSSVPEKKTKIEMRIFIPGEDVYADAEGSNFPETLGRVSDKIIGQLRKRNEIQKEKR